MVRHPHPRLGHPRDLRAEAHWEGIQIASDCIVHTVELLDTSLSITSPQDGSDQQTFVTVEGTYVGNRYVDPLLLAQFGPGSGRARVGLGQGVTSL